MNTNIFFNHCFDKRRFQNFLYWFFKNRKQGQFQLLKLLEKLKFLGFHSATEAGFSISVEDLKIPSSKSILLLEAENQIFDADFHFKVGNLTKIERYQRLIEIWNRTSEKLKEQVVRCFQITDFFNPVYLMSFSGARGNISQVRQLVGMRGLMADPQGQIIDFPIRSNFREGLTLTEYLISCSGARKGIVDTALRTAASGYLTRRLVDVAHQVIISQIDCQKNNTTNGIVIEDLFNQKKKVLSLQQRLVGRILAETIEVSLPTKISTTAIAFKNQEISKTLSYQICQYRKKVYIRSPLTCHSSKFICQLCYGWNLAEGQLVSIGEAVGVLAAQSIGEPGTQLTMRTFHTGGVFSGILVDQTYSPISGNIHYPSTYSGLLIRTQQGIIAYLSKNNGRLTILKPIVQRFQLGRNTLSFQQPHSDLQRKNFRTQLQKIRCKIANSLRNVRQHSLLDKKKLCLSPLIQSQIYPFARIKTLEKLRLGFLSEFIFQSSTLLYVRQGENIKKTQLIAEFPFFNNEKSLQNEISIRSPVSGEIYFDNMAFIEKTKIELTQDFVQGLGEFWVLVAHSLHFSKTKVASFLRKLDLIDEQVPFSQRGIQLTSLKKVQFKSLAKQKAMSEHQSETSKNMQNFQLKLLFFKKIGYLQISEQQQFKRLLLLKNWIMLRRNSKAMSPNAISFIQNFETWGIGLQLQSKYKTKAIAKLQFVNISPMGLYLATSLLDFGQTLPLETYMSGVNLKAMSKPQSLYRAKLDSNLFFHENGCQFSLNRQGLEFIKKQFDFYHCPVNLLNLKRTKSKPKPIFMSYTKLKLQNPQLLTLTKINQYLIKYQLKALALQLFDLSQNTSAISKLSCKKLFDEICFLFLKKSLLLVNLPNNWTSVKRTAQDQPQILHWYKLPYQKYIFIIDFIKDLQDTIGCFDNAFGCFDIAFEGSNVSTSRLNKIGYYVVMRISLALFSIKKFNQTNLLESQLKTKAVPTSLLDAPTSLLDAPTSLLDADSFYKIFRAQTLMKKLNFKFFIKKKKNFLIPLPNVQNKRSDQWMFFGDCRIRTKYPTYFKNYVQISSSYLSRKKRNLVYSDSSNFVCFSKILSHQDLHSEKSQKRYRNIQDFFLFEKIFPKSMVENDNDNKYLQNNQSVCYDQIQKTTLDFYFQSYFFLFSSFYVVQNFEVRFTHIQPQKPTYNTLAQKLDNQEKQLKTTELQVSWKKSLDQLDGIAFKTQLQLLKKAIEQNEIQSFYARFSKKSLITFKNRAYVFPNGNSELYLIRYFIQSSMFFKKIYQPKKNLNRTYFLVQQFEPRLKSLVLDYHNFINFYHLCFKNKIHFRIFAFYFLTIKIYFESKKKARQVPMQLNRALLDTSFEVSISPLDVPTSRVLTTPLGVSTSFLKSLENNIAKAKIQICFETYRMSLISIFPLKKKSIVKETKIQFLQIRKMTKLDFLKKKVKNYWNSVHIIKKNYAQSFETQIFIRFYPYSNFQGEIVDKIGTACTLSQLFVTHIFDYVAYRRNFSKNKMTKQINGFLSQPKRTEVQKLGSLIRKSEDLIGLNVFFIDIGQFIAKTEKFFIIRKGTASILNHQSILHIYHGQMIEKNQRIYSIFYQQSKTGDIVQGIPKIEEIFEARKRSKLTLKKLSLFSQDFLSFEKKMSHYLKSLQKSVVTNIQRIYCGQGIHISDKHIEIIVRQMTSNVIIRKPGQTGLLCGEIVALQWVVQLNTFSHQIIYEPILLGMTKTCLETSSFLSAASFQETTRILSRAALNNQTDFLRGLKQNVILGNLIPVGTGYF